MRLDQGSLIFTPQNGECPSWETALGQSREPRDDMPPYYFKAEGYENILIGMYFNSVPLAKTSCVLGKKKLFVTASESYSNPEYQEIQLASKFDNVIVHFQNNAKIFRNTPIILLLTKIQDVNKSHYRRRSIKYSPHTTYDTIKNQESFEEIQRHYDQRLMCYGVFVEHFDTLHLYCINANANDYSYEKLKIPETDLTDWADWEIKERGKENFQKCLEIPIIDESFVRDLNDEQIVQKLATILNQEWECNGYPGVHYFGFKYSKLLKQIKASPAEIIKWANEHNTDNRIPTTYNGEISKMIKVFECAEKDNDVKVAYHGTAGVNENSANHIVDNLNKLENSHQTLPIPNFTPSQIIYYGVPGCGKSNQIREQLKDVPEKNKVRVVFHPEYTNAEFIGQILPKVNGHVTYEFTPGPFTQIIKRAYLNPNEQFYLVIEEINRGNAAAIFGDTFQLLDRLKVGETDSLGNDSANAAVNTFTEGWSQYFVQNDDINAYVRKATKQDDGSYQERNDGESIEEIKIKEIHFNANTAIRLPPNLSILATMNTSDQNVFTLDNAFQRRFDMELVRNEFDLNKPSVKTQYEAEIDDTGVTWGKFWGWINAKITASLKGLSSTEDKRLGVWFVSNVGGIIDDKVFAEKVLKFLWDDVFKFKRPQVFAEEIDTLEKLINSFENPLEGKERFDVFKDKANLVAFVASPTL